MIDILGFALLRPYWLLGLIAALAIGLITARRGRLSSAWSAAIEPALLAGLARLGRISQSATRSRIDPVMIAAIIIALIVLALAGPARESRDGTAFRNLDAVVLIFDLSHSVTEGGHLAEARATARMIAASAGSRPVELIVFAGDAYIASGFTTDQEQLGTTIAVLDGETVPERGDRTARALSLAHKTLTDANIIYADVVLVSAGGGIDDGAVAEVTKLQVSGYRVSAVYVQPSLAHVNAPQRGPLDSLVRIGGGTSADVIDPTPIANEISQFRAARLTNSALSVLVWSDYGRYVLVLALIPTLLLFRRRA